MHTLCQHLELELGLVLFMFPTLLCEKWFGSGEGDWEKDGTSMCLNSRSIRSTFRLGVPSSEEGVIKHNYSSLCHPL